MGTLTLDEVRLDAENKSFVYNDSGALTNINGADVQAAVTYSDVVKKAKDNAAVAVALSA